MKKMLALTLVFLQFFVGPLAMAQAATDVFLSDTKRDLGIVAASGIGGAVIGLSTLSFVDKPSKNLKNVVIGGAIGIIIGVGVVAYLQATQTTKTYEESSSLVPTRDFSTQERLMASLPVNERREENRQEILQLQIPVLSF